MQVVGCGRTASAVGTDPAAGQPSCGERALAGMQGGTNPETQLGANRMVDAHTRQQSRELLLVATLVTSLAKQLAVLLLGHTLAALLDYRTHSVSSVQLIAQRTLRPREGTSVNSTYLRIA